MVKSASNRLSLSPRAVNNTLKTIRIGTSGFSFADWKGEFYPAGLPAGKFLEYYAERFPTVEINATYYAIPSPAVAQKMIARTPESFDFMVKAHASFTHQRHLAASRRDEYLKAIEPFHAAGRLAGALAQFPYSFKHSPANQAYVESAREYFPDRPVFVEFRHDSWYQKSVFYALKEKNIGWVSVDLPKLAHLPQPYAVASTETAYVRLHGRNADKWYEGGDERYNYLYSEEELAEWKAKLEKLNASSTYAFFNNCYRGQAVKNARELIELFDL